MSQDKSAEAKLAGFLAKYDMEIAGLAEAVREEMRKFIQQRLSLSTTITMRWLLGLVRLNGLRRRSSPSRFISSG